tara:strand:- start:155 stop:424 length:270 start_codon:yes stop_codon:yes gene_type:complete
LTATLYWINDNQPFATLKMDNKGLYIWEWLIDDPKGIMDRFFKTAFFCTNCGEREKDTIMAISADGTKYSISQLVNLFFNCHIILRKTN